MKNLSNKTLFILSLVFTLVSGILIYYSYLNFKEISSEQNVFKDQNKTLKNELKLKEESISLYKVKLDSINVKKKDMEDTISKYEGLNEKVDTNLIINNYNKYLLSYIPANFDYSRNSSLQEKTNRYRKLIATFFGDVEVNDFTEANGNVLIGNISFNDYILDSLNKKIVENNNRVLKKIGLLNYYTNTSNYLVKYRLFKEIEEKRAADSQLYSGNELKNFTENVIFLKNKVIEGYDIILFPNSENTAYLSEIKSILEREKKSSEYNSVELSNNLKEENKKIAKYLVLSIDIFSQNIDYMGSYNILDKTYELNGKIQVLRYLVDNRNRLYMVEERQSGTPTKIVYFNSSGNPFFELDLKNYKEIYFDADSSSEIKSKYNEAKKLYSDF